MSPGQKFDYALLGFGACLVFCLLLVSLATGLLR